MFSRLIAILILCTISSAQLPNWFLRSSTGIPIDINGTCTIAHDPGRGRSLMFDHRTSTTWEWDGAMWTARPSAAPQSRSARMAWDSLRNRFLLVTSTRLYEWTPTGWSIVNQTLPFPGRDDFAIAFDDRRGVLVLHGGEQCCSLEYMETWEFDGTVWRQRSAGGPRGRSFHTLSYDASRGVCVLFGGRAQSAQLYFDDVWEWDGTQWREFYGVRGPAARIDASMTYDSARQRVILFGGRLSNDYFDSWAWNGSSWQQLTTPARPSRSRGAMTYDTRRFVAVFASPHDGQTWELLDGASTQASFTNFGAGCAGTNGTPLLSASGSSTPRLGGTFQMVLSPTATHVLSQSFGVIGASTTQWLGVPLPLPIGNGAPGCELLVSVDDVLPLTRVGSTATWTLAIPFDPQYLGTQLAVQGLVLDPGANSLGLVVSNGGRLVIGL